MAGFGLACALLAVASPIVLGQQNSVSAVTQFLTYPADGTPVSAKVTVKIEESCEEPSMSFTSLADVSSSMEEEIADLKTVNDFLIGYLGPKDYLGIVSFNGKARVDVKLSPVTNQNRKTMQEAVTRFTAYGSTNIYDALRKGMRQQTSAGSLPRSVLQNVILFSDGEPTAGVEEPPLIVDLVRSTVSNSTVRVNALGFGTGIKLKLMQDIAKAGRGNSDYIPNGRGRRISKIFGSILGLAHSTCLQDLTAIIEPAQGCSIIKIETPYPISKNGDKFVVTIPDMAKGETRDIFVFLDCNPVPVVSRRFINDEQSPVLSFEVQAQSLTTGKQVQLGKGESQVKRSSSCSGQKCFDSQTKNSDWEVSSLRNSTALAMELALSMSSGDKAAAINTLNAANNLLKSSGVANDPLIIALSKDVEKIIALLNKGQLSDDDRNVISAGIYALQYQRSFGGSNSIFESTDLIVTDAQKAGRKDAELFVKQNLPGDPCACAIDGISGGVPTEYMGCKVFLKGSPAFCMVRNPANCKDKVVRPSSKYPGAGYIFCQAIGTCACTLTGVSGGVDTGQIGCDTTFGTCYVRDPSQCPEATKSEQFPDAAFVTCAQNSALREDQTPIKETSLSHSMQVQT